MVLRITQRPRYRILWLSLLALASCQSEASPPDSAPVDVIGVEGTDLPTLLAGLDPRDAAVIEGFEEMVPGSIPDTAVAWAAFTAGQDYEPPQPTRDLIVASVRSTHLEVRTICVDAGAQLPCAEKGDIWQMNFSAPQGAVLDVGGARGQTPPAAVLLVVHGDEHRAEPASRGFWIDDGPDVGDIPGDRYRRDPILGGCGFATFVDDLTPRSTFTPLTAAARSSTVYLLVQVCEDAATDVIVPLLVVDATTVELVERSGGGVAVEPGATYLFEFDLSAYSSADRLQAFVLPVPDREALVSWPLRLTD